MTTSTPTDPDLLRSMLTIRISEERMLDLRQDGKILGSVHPCIGQESVPVGVIASLDERDRVLATYRGHGWALAKGVPLAAFFGELMGRTTGTNGGRAGSPYFTRRPNMGSSVRTVLSRPECRSPTVLRWDSLLQERAASP